MTNILGKQTNVLFHKQSQGGCYVQGPALRAAGAARITPPLVLLTTCLRISERRWGQHVNNPKMRQKGIQCFQRANSKILQELREEENVSRSVGGENQRRLHGSSGFEIDLERKYDFVQCALGVTFCVGIEGGVCREGCIGGEPDQCHVSRHVKHYGRWKKEMRRKRGEGGGHQHKGLWGCELSICSVGKWKPTEDLQQSGMTRHMLRED